MLAQVLQGYQPYLPFFLIGSIALAVIAVFLLMVMGRKAVDQARKRQALSRSPDPRPSFAQRLSGVGTRWQRFKAWVKGLFSRWGWNPTDDCAMSFRQTLSILKTYLPGRHPEYALPWFMLVGSEKSGKSEILTDVDLELPLGKPTYSVDSEISGVSWTFFDRGVVLEVNGESFLDDDKAISDDASWTRLLRLLNRFRARRPLDGLVITIPAGELYGSSRLGEAEILERARHMYTKLWKMQAILGMRLPVYILVTKCDLIPGFKSFATEVPAESQGDMFGWSSPYAMDATYNTGWVDDIFDHLHRSINRLRAGIFAQGHARRERDGILLFPLEFMTLRDSVGAYLNGIFRESAYHESFFLRGIYFSGKAVTQDGVALTARGVLEDTQVRAQGLDEKQARKEHGIFLRDLFDKKIFQEGALAKPVRRVLISTSRLLNFSKAAAALVCAGWLFGIFQNYKDLEVGNQTLMPSLKRINSAMEGIEQQGGYSDTQQFRDFLNQQASSILDGFANLSPVSSFSFFMPSSWFSPLDDRIQNSYAIAYDHVILPSFYSALLKRIEHTVSVGQIEYKNDLRKPFINPVQSPSYGLLSDYVRDITDIEKYVAIFNDLDVSSNIQDIGRLVKYLFGQDLPKGFFSHSQYYEGALSRIVDRNIDLSQFRVLAGQKMGVLFKNFIDSAFDVHKNFPLFEKVQNDIDHWTHTGALSHMHAMDLRKLTQNTVAVADIISSGDLSWIDHTSFEPSVSYAQMLQDITASHLLGGDLAKEMTRLADAAFSKFKLTLSDLKTRVTGPFFTIVDNHLVGEPSEGLIRVIDALSEFLAEKFMEPINSQNLVTKLEPGKLLFWDETALIQAEDVVDAYNEFIATRLPGTLEGLQNLFRIVGRNGTRDRVTALVAQAQTFQQQPAELVGFSSREILQSQVQNVAAATPHFTKLLGMFEASAYVEGSVALRELLVKQNYGILERIEKLLEADNLYNGRDEAFEWWDGSPMVGIKAFGVHGIGDMRTYLTAQRFQIAYLAKDMAEPILTLLSLGYLEDVPYDLPLATRWSKIASVLTDYDKQSPGNSLKLLEQFLTYDINELSIENCDLGDFDGFDADGDYFLEVRNRYAVTLMNRCEALRGHRAVERYNRAASFFNINLAGRFPFTKDAGRSTTFEADPADVETFFQIYDSLNKKDRQIILETSRLAGAQDSLTEFMNKVDSVRPLMLASLDRGMKDQVPHIDIDVSFRTNRDEEIGGDKIIDWSMDFGTNQIDFRGRDASGRWQVGAPVDVSLKWAVDSDSVPVADPRNPALEVVGTKALFSYRGRWSLIRLLREHATDQSVMDRSKNPDPQVLQFLVPTAYNKSCYQGEPPLAMDRKSQSARVYCQIDMHIPITAEPDAATGISLKEVRHLGAPRFPYEAPVVDAVPSKRLRRN
ncbi:MAG: type VI secretion system protein [Proteobacteria bacterium]|nr:type VI secretion system protein [Pseudomonadota bacterium]